VSRVSSFKFQSHTLHSAGYPTFRKPGTAAAEAKAEGFGGYEYFHASSGVNGVDSFNLNGWDLAANGYVNRYLGITADFSVTYGTPSVIGVGVNTHLYTYLFGPMVRASAGKVQPFAHALFGGAHISGSVTWAEE
jgi:hypothetical protein